jgi:hypothetical protein
MVLDIVLQRGVLTILQKLIILRKGVFSRNNSILVVTELNNRQDYQRCSHSLGPNEIDGIPSN